jgi:hypothetical protein
VIVDPETDIQYGTKIGRFLVVGELGRGGMGVVYSAHDRELDRKVALKVLRAAEATEEEQMRMLREGQAMARITHPNVITVFEVGVEGKLVFLAQELLDAGTLGKWLSSPHSPAEVLDKFVAAGRGLAAAHAAGLVHRDFKPDNVLLGKDGRVRVSDFGLARALADADLASATRANMARAQLELAKSPMSPLTRTGAVMGTPMFMAPEQHEGSRADERSDQFAFAVALYQALYGDWPFAGKTAVALADNVIAGRMQPPPKGAQVSARLRQILLRALATRPGDRYPSMDALLADLTRPPGRKLRNVVLAISVATLAAGAVVGGYILRERDDKRTEAPIDPKLLDKQLEGLATAIESDKLVDAAEKLELTGSLELSGGDAVKATIAWSADALLLELGGDLGRARTQLQLAETNAGSDTTAGAYADMAASAVAHAGGDLQTAFDRSARCAKALTDKVPLLGALCHELHGAVAADRGDIPAARDSYERALAIVKQQQNAPRELTLQLAMTELDFDAGRQDDVAANAEALQLRAAERGATSVEARAWVLLARAHVAQAETQKALKDLEHVDPKKIEALDVRVRLQLALYQVHALLGDDPDAAQQPYDAARAAAEKQGYVGLVLAARLARLYVDQAKGVPEAKDDQRALIEEAKARGYKRIVHLAETVGER